MFPAEASEGPLFSPPGSGGLVRGAIYKRTDSTSAAVISKALVLPALIYKLSVCVFLKWLCRFHVALYTVGECLGSFKSGDVMGRYHHCRVFRNVASYFFGAFFYYESAESPQVHVLAFNHRITDGLHE